MEIRGIEYMIQAIDRMSPDLTADSLFMVQYKRAILDNIVASTDRLRVLSDLMLASVVEGEGAIPTEPPPASE